MSTTTGRPVRAMECFLSVSARSCARPDQEVVLDDGARDADGVALNASSPMAGVGTWPEMITMWESHESM